MTPKHIGIILDGNGRWATAKGLPRTAGHEAGVKRVVEIARLMDELGVEVLSLYAFSTENWKRPASEVGALMRLLLQFLSAYMDEFMTRRVRLRFMGDTDALPLPVKSAIRRAEEKTRKNGGAILNIGLNYGGHDEILRAMRRLQAEGQDLRTLDAETFSAHLDTGDLPPLDLLIRTGGEQRLSNFMLWQVAYTELYFTKILWPDFDRSALEEALAWFSMRDRRYGGIH